MPKIIQKLLESNITLFKDLDPVELRLLLGSLRHQVAHPGDTVIELGDTRGRVHLVMSGQFQCEIPTDAGFAPIEALLPGMQFGAVCFVLGVPSNMRIVCTRKGSVLFFDQVSLAQAALEDKVRHNLALALATHMYDARDRLGQPLAAGPTVDLSLLHPKP